VSTDVSEEHIVSIFRVEHIFFDPEDGGDMFLRNIGWHSTDYTVLYPRSWYSSDENNTLKDLRFSQQ
jgi:hypothetical protein